MSYQVLARKWRPKNFNELVGQEHVVRALVNALDNDRLHHAFLFSGTRGVGKTTIARILAKSINCETNGISSEPCGTCPACVEINEGRFLDLIEVDAASRTKVDETRELLDNVQYAPTHGRYKVYLIDEVHMLSKHSFNALLKTLEEPPPHVKFLLATTDPQKLPITVLSRCLQFNLKRIPETAMHEHLSKVLTAENIPFDDEALDLLSVAADGSLRDALSLVDQAIPYGSGEVRVKEVRDMLGTIDREHVFQLLEALAESDASALMTKVADMDTLAPDYAQVLDAMNDILQRMAIAKEVPAALASRTDRKRLLSLSKVFSAEKIQLFYQIALHGRRDLYLSPTARGGFEMTVLRMLAFSPDDADIPVSEKKTFKSVKSSASSKAPGKTPSKTTSPTQRSETVSASVNHQTQNSATSAAIAPKLSVVENSVVETQVEETVEPVKLSVVQTSEPQAVLAPITKPGKSDEKADLNITNWVEYYKGLPLKGAVRQLAKHCVLQSQDLGVLRLNLASIVAPMLSDSLRKELQDIICLHETKSVVLQIDVAEIVGVTPAAQEKIEATQKKQNAIKAIEQDPFVQAVQKQFSARVDPKSIRVKKPK